MQRRDLPDGWDADIPVFPADEKGIASRDSSGQVLNAVARRVPWLLGGAADLAPSTKTRLTFDGAGDFEPDDRAGRNFHFGVREHASAAIANGLARLEAPAVLVGLPDLLRLRARGDPALGAHGDPGPPHLHARLDRRRRGRADAPAGRAARVAAGDSRPARVPPGGRERGRRDVALRDAAPPRAGCPRSSRARRCRPSTDRRRRPRRSVDERRVRPRRRRRRRARRDPDRDRVRGRPRAVGARRSSPRRASARASSACRARSSSTASRRSTATRCIPPSVKARVAIEQASTLGWHRYVGDGGAIVGMHTFGASAPLKMLVEKFGFTPDAVARVARERVAAAQDT